VPQETASQHPARLKPQARRASPQQPHHKSHHTLWSAPYPPAPPFGDNPPPNRAVRPRCDSDRTGSARVPRPGPRAQGGRLFQPGGALPRRNCAPEVGERDREGRSAHVRPTARVVSAHPSRERQVLPCSAWSVPASVSDEFVPRLVAALPGRTLSRPLHRQHLVSRPREWADLRLRPRPRRKRHAWAVLSRGEGAPALVTIAEQVRNDLRRHLDRERTEEFHEQYSWTWTAACEREDQALLALRSTRALFTEAKSAGHIVADWSQLRMWRRHAAEGHRAAVLHHSKPEVQTAWRALLLVLMDNKAAWIDVNREQEVDTARDRIEQAVRGDGDS